MTRFQVKSDGRTAFGRVLREGASFGRKGDVQMHERSPLEILIRSGEMESGWAKGPHPP